MTFLEVIENFDNYSYISTFEDHIMIKKLFYFAIKAFEDQFANITFVPGGEAS